MDSVKESDKVLLYGYRQDTCWLITTQAEISKGMDSNYTIPTYWVASTLETFFVLVEVSLIRIYCNYVHNVIYKQYLCKLCI